MSKNAAEKLESLRTMPELSHWPDKTKPFDASKSEVAKWLATQSDILEWLVGIMAKRGLIEFVRDSKKWKGVDTLIDQERKSKVKLWLVIENEKSIQFSTSPKSETENKMLTVPRSIISSINKLSKRSQIAWEECEVEIQTWYVHQYKLIPPASKYKNFVKN